MKKIIKQILILICLIAVLILPYFVFAQETMMGELKKVGGEGGYDIGANQYTVSQIAGTVVKAFLGLLGVIFIILMLFAGYNWMTAGGDEEKITKAKNTIKTAIIGLIIVVGAWAIWYFVFTMVITG